MKKYNEPLVEVIKLDTLDVITTSGGYNDDLVNNDLLFDGSEFFTNP